MKEVFLGIVRHLTELLSKCYGGGVFCNSIVKNQHPRRAGWQPGVSLVEGAFRPLEQLGNADSQSLGFRGIGGAEIVNPLGRGLLGFL